MLESGHHINDCVAPQPLMERRRQHRKSNALRSIAFGGSIAVAALIPNTDITINAETYRIPDGCTIEAPDTFNRGKRTGAEPSEPTKADINTINWLNVMGTVNSLSNHYHPVDEFIDDKSGLKFVIYSDGNNVSVNKQSISEYLNTPMQLAKEYDNPSLRHKMMCTAEAVYKNGALKDEVVNIYIPSDSSICFSNQALVNSALSECDIDAYSIARFSLVFGLANVNQSVVFALGDDSKATKQEQIEVGIHELAGHILDYVAGVHINGQKNEEFAYYLTEETLKEAEQAGLILDPFLEYEFASTTDQGDA